MPNWISIIGSVILTVLVVYLTIQYIRCITAVQPQCPVCIKPNAEPKVSFTSNKKVPINPGLVSANFQYFLRGDDLKLYFEGLDENSNRKVISQIDLPRQAAYFAVRDNKLVVLDEKEEVIRELSPGGEFPLVVYLSNEGQIVGIGSKQRILWSLDKLL